MFGLTAQITQMPDLKEKAKQMRFGIALGLTATAKEAQKASQDAIQGTFTVRGRWFEQQNRFGIKIKPAKKDDLEAEVKTKADWLAIHEEGGTKTALHGGDVVVPTDQVRRNKRMIIPRGQRPRGLGAKAFVLQTKHGPVLAQRISRGKRKGLIILYGIEHGVRIKKQSTFYEPILKVVNRNLEKNIREGIAKAWATAK